MTDWLFAYFYFAARLFVPAVAHKTSFDWLDVVEGAVHLTKIIQEKERSGKGARSKDGELGAAGTAAFTEKTFD